MKKIFFLTVRSLSCDAQSCLSVSVELLLGSPSSSNESRNVQRWVGVFIMGGGISKWENKSISKYYKRHGRCTFLHFPPLFFFKQII